MQRQASGQQVADHQESGDSGVPMTDREGWDRTEIGKRAVELAARDRFAALLGIECISCGPGHAAARMKVHPDHLNFHGTCHGGVTFALADTAFALASNAQGTPAASIDAHITYHAAVQAGEVLTATATEVSRSRRLAVYRIDVNRADGMLVCAFTGTVFLSARPAKESASR